MPGMEMNACDPGWQLMGFLKIIFVARPERGTKVAVLLKL